MNPDPRSHVYIVVPAFNEARVLEGVVLGLRHHFDNVVVVDDGSSDETSRSALKAGAHVVRHPVNLGQGASLQTGLTYAIGQGAQYIATFDADGQHDPLDVIKMFNTVIAKGVDVALGSRFLGTTVDMPTRRRVVLKGARWVNYVATGVKLTDAHNGLRLLNRSVASSIKLRQPRMAHATEIIASIANAGATYCEVPVTIRYTEYSMAKGQRLSNSLNILIDLILRGLLK